MQYLSKANAALIMLRGARNEATLTDGKFEIMVRGREAYTYGRDAREMGLTNDNAQWHYLTFEQYLQALNKMRLIVCIGTPKISNVAKRKTKQATFFLPVKQTV